MIARELAARNQSFDAGNRGTPIRWRSVTLHLFVVAVASAFLATCAAADGQAPPPLLLSETVRSHVRDERFQIVTSVRGLPLGVRDAMQELFGGPTLAIAEPDDRFQVTDAIIEPNLPFRRLRLAGCSTDHCIVYYERGGIAHSWHAALFRWTPEATRFEWGGTAPGGLASIDEVRTALLSGLVKGPSTSW